MNKEYGAHTIVITLQLNLRVQGWGLPDISESAPDSNWSNWGPILLLEHFPMGLQWPWVGGCFCSVCCSYQCASSSYSSLKLCAFKWVQPTKDFSYTFA